MSLKFVYKNIFTKIEFFVEIQKIQFYLILKSIIILAIFLKSSKF